jgi:hypothetical protein
MRIEFGGYPDGSPALQVTGTASCDDVRFPEMTEVGLSREGVPVAGHPSRVIAREMTATLAGAAAVLRAGDVISAGFIKDFGSQGQPGTPGFACHAYLQDAVPVSGLIVSGVEYGHGVIRVVTGMTAPRCRELRDALTVALTAMGWTVTGLADEKEATARIYGPQSGR